MKKMEEENNIVEILKKIANNAYAPYSNFRVAALFENSDKTYFYGVNIENAAYPNTMCAERVGIHSAINNSIKIDNVKVIHIYSPDSNEFLSPCGGCRQTLSEHINDNCEIRMYNKNGDYISKQFYEIFPLKIDSKNIKGNN